MFDGFLSESIIKRAISNNHIEVEIINFREFSKEKNKHVDDYQYGGGAGMVLMLQPIIDCLKQIKTSQSKVILLSPQGKTLSQSTVKQLTNLSDHLILICGHYEGFDERINHYIDMTISIGDYILTGGEIPAMVIMDAIIRLRDQVINPLSLQNESFDDYLLDYPVYTKPLKYDGYQVPDILVSGNHQKINDWRKQQQIIKTLKNRPDLYKKYLKLKDRSK